MRILKFVFAALAFSLAATVVTAQENKDAPKKAAPKAQAKSNRPTSTKWDTTDLGQFFSSGLEAPAPDGKGRVRPALKAVSIKVGPNDEATMCFDTERLRMAVGWSGGFLKLPTGREGLEGVPQPVGEIAFSSAAQPGWANASGSFDEPNPPKRDGNELVSFGPLPREWAKWRGLYLNGKQVVLSYTVGKAGVLELPGYDAEKKIFTRSFEVKDSSAPITLLVCEDAKAAGGMEGETAVLTSGERCVAVHYSGRAKASLEVKDGRVLAKLPALGKTELFKISLWSGAKAELPAALAALKAGTPITNPAVLTKGGPARWNPVIETKGELGAGDAPYVVDTLTLPDENPWNSWLRTSGFDFFKDATRAAVCTVNGEVWIVGGIDEKLEHLKWKRFATGLFQPLGLKIVNDEIYVLGRDQITRLHDLNGDGEADFYENFNNDVAISSHYHEFCLNLDTDSKGNFYFTKGGNLGGWKHQHHGALLRVSSDGSKLDVVSYGLRAPNGMSVGPHDEITVADNEGNWVPSSRVDLVKPGVFLGHVFNAHTPEPPTSPGTPILWLPHSYDVDNSSGGQAWVTSDKWGPFKGDLLHMSYGASALHKVMMETADGQIQGGAFKFPLKFKTGIMRGRFNPRDGQLYLTGLVVWQSNGAQKGAFQRVRYTGKPVDMPKELHVKPNGVLLTFTDKLDKSLAEDTGSYSVDQWNYKWTSNYGSKEWSVAEPDKMKHDPLDVKSAKLQPDGKSVFLELGPLAPVMQMQVKLNLKGADGAPITQTIWNTINKVPAK